MQTPERKWCPADWLDEMPPTLGTSPSDFLRRGEDGLIRLTPLGDDEIEPVVLAAGDAVEFEWTELRGTSVLTLMPDGGFTVDPPFPDDTNCFRLDDGFYEMGHSIADLIESIRDAEDKRTQFEVDGWVWESGGVYRLRALESGALHFEHVSEEGPFQHRVAPWMQACFGPQIAADKVERNHRFLEEALELVQACGCSREDAHALVDYVFDRPVGYRWQEVGGVMVTLAALCLAHDLDMHRWGEIELRRIWTKVPEIRAKQAAKPKGSPLPQTAPIADAVGQAMSTLTDEQKARPLA